jgi:hypothetical protein
MPIVGCPCGTTFQAQPGDAACPACKAIHTVDAPPIVVCECGEAVELPSRESGARRVCPACGKLVEVREPGVAAPASGPIPPGLRLVLSLLFVLAFLPLLFGKGAPQLPRADSAPTGITLEDWNKAQRAFKVRNLPGAAYERESATPWILAIVAGEIFWAYLLVAFPWGGSSLRKALGAGALALVAAGVTLLILKWGASLGSDTYRPRGRGAIFYYLLKFLGFSYEAGLNPRNGFFTPWICFTFGGGLLLSLARALPVLLWYRKNKALDVRGAVSWGLLGGASVGAMQAAFYGSSFFNGVAGLQTYLEMIVSGTALSAVCGGISALVLWRLEEDVLSMDGWHEWLILILVVGAAGSAPHALYDTFWKAGSAGAAFAVAVLAFLGFFGFYGWAVKKEKVYSAVPA